MVISVAAADWSGARSGEQRSLWLAEWDATDGAVVRVQGLTRLGAVARLEELAGRNPGLVAGLDFSFSLPAWWLVHNRVASAPELWADGAILEGWLERCEPPFWGRPGRPRPALPREEAFRTTELAAPGRPASTFQVGGAGAVGTASLRGMPALHRLRSSGFAVWPFDRWRLPAVVEVWPRLAIGGLVKSQPAARAAWVRRQGRLLRPAVAAAAATSADALDATAAALALAALPGPRPDVTDPTVLLEGWIDGVEGVGTATPARRRTAAPPHRPADELKSGSAGRGHLRPGASRPR